MAKKLKHDWKIWAKKFGINVALALVTGLIILWQENTAYVAIIPLLLAIQNYIKHRA